MDWKQFIRLDRAAGNLAVDSPPRGKRTALASVGRRRSGKRRLAMRWGQVVGAALESSHVPESVSESFGAGENPGGRPLFAGVKGGRLLTRAYGTLGDSNNGWSRAIFHSRSTKSYT